MRSGFGDLVTRSLEEYEGLALRLANDPERLADDQSASRANRDMTPLFDTAGYTRAAGSGLSHDVGAAPQRRAAGELHGRGAAMSGSSGKTPPPGYTPPPPQVIQTLRQAFGLHQQGQLAQAETLYREVLSHAAGQFRCAAFPGRAGVAAGTARGGSFADRSRGRGEPAQHAAFYNRAGILRDMARLEEALQSYDRRSR